MTTVINTPGTGNESDSSASMVILVIVLLVAGVLFFIYALPAMRDSRTTPQNGTIDVNVKLPVDKTPTPTP